MLSWAGKKVFQGATGATDAPADADTTQFEAPDTPAPVFAARAIKYAIFGTPAAPRDAPVAEAGRVESTTETNATSKDLKSPAKPNGILFTPGTASARRKRVSFGHDVKYHGTNGDANLLAPITENAGQNRKKTALQQALENSRASKGNNSASKEKAAKTTAAQPGNDAQARAAVKDKAGSKPNGPINEESEDDWEDDVCNHDVTVDLNEPHSRSGKYWQSQFNKYSQEAREEMARLVKYKHLAKLYAEKKDTEAGALNEKLKEQQQVVAKMEKKIKTLEAQVADKRKRGADTDDATLKKLADKTALASQYRDRVKELETLLKDHNGSSNHNRRGVDTSPGTQSTLLEVQRELKQARFELKKMDRLREEVDRLRSELKVARQQSTVLREEQKQLREAKNSSQDELKKLRKDYDSIKENAKSQHRQALQVLKEKNHKITVLEQEIKTLKERDVVPSRPKSLDAAIAEHNRFTRDLKSDIESLSKPSIHEKAKSIRLPKRSFSAEDLTIDLTQRSLLADDTYPRPGTTWADSLIDIEEQLRREKEERMETRKRDDALVADFSLAKAKQHDKLTALKSSIPSPGSRRPDILTDRVNGSSPKDLHTKSNSRRVPSSRFTSFKHHDHIMHVAPSNLAPRKADYGRPLSSGSDAPTIDLVHERFARLGGPDMNYSVVTGNTSRCTLPADRQAAAKARLEQKRRERRYNLGDKENARPQTGLELG